MEVGSAHRQNQQLSISSPRKRFQIIKKDAVQIRHKQSSKCDFHRLRRPSSPCFLSSCYIPTPSKLDHIRKTNSTISASLSCKTEIAFRTAALTINSAVLRAKVASPMPGILQFAALQLPMQKLEDLPSTLRPSQKPTSLSERAHTALFFQPQQPKS